MEISESAAETNLADTEISPLSRKSQSRKYMQIGALSANKTKTGVWSNLVSATITG